MLRDSEHPAWGDAEQHYPEAKKFWDNDTVSALPELRPELQEHHLFRRRIIFGQRNFEPIMEALNEEKGFAVVTGLLLRSTMHFGTKCVIDQLKIYQDLGADIFIAFSDTENWFKGYSIWHSVDRAMEKFLVDCLALGLEPNLKKLQIYSQWSRKEILPLAVALSRFAPLNGGSKSDSLAPLSDSSKADSLGMTFFPMVVAADILHPQLEKYGGPRPTLVPVGQNQRKHIDPAYKVMEKYIRATSAASGKPRMIAPTIVYHRMLMGTNGEKMTARSDEVGQFAIRLHDEPGKIHAKLIKSKTGEDGGGRSPHRCPLYELLLFHEEKDDDVIRIYDNCTESNGWSCVECKNQIAKDVADWVEGFQKKVEKLKKDRDVLKFVLEQDILRETEAVVEITEGVLEGETSYE